MSPKIFKQCYESILAGDPKRRSFRAIYSQVYQDIVGTSRKEQSRRDKQ